MSCIQNKEVLYNPLPMKKIFLDWVVLKIKEKGIKYTFGAPKKKMCILVVEFPQFFGALFSLIWTLLNRHKVWAKKTRINYVHLEFTDVGYIKYLLWYLMKTSIPPRTYTSWKAMFSSSRESTTSNLRASILM